MSEGNGHRDDSPPQADHLVSAAGGIAAAWGETAVAARVREAETLVREWVAANQVRHTDDLLSQLTDRIHDYSVASLAIWHLLDRGELRFTSWDRRELQRTEVSRDNDW